MIKFSKMHGAGNDFVIVTAENVKGLDYSILAKKMCDRHFGIGADGLMIVENSVTSDIQMIYYNSDGSRAEMCGNGIRCFSKFVYNKKIVTKKDFTVETLAGEKKIKLYSTNNNVQNIVVDMGKPSLNTKDIPVKSDKETFINQKIIVKDQEINVSSILMGVPHTVIFVDNLEKYPVNRIGPIIENYEIFTQKTNVNFVEIVERNFIKVDTWERGAGKTLACGTGVCASVYISKLLKYVDDKVFVQVPGGKLNIFIDKDDNIFMEGSAEFICDGKYYLKDDLKIEWINGII